MHLKSRINFPDRLPAVLIGLIVFLFFAGQVDAWEVSSIVGKWRTSGGLDVYIDKPANEVRVTVVRPDAGSLVYRGTFDGRRLDVSYLLKGGDFSTSSPPQVVSQLQGKVQNYYVLELSEDAMELRGRQFGDSWQWDTETFEILSFKPRKDSGGVKVIWTRQPDAVQVRFTDRNFEQISIVPFYTVEGTGLGTGEVWIEVTVPAADTDFDDRSIERIPVKVRSESDPEGRMVTCIETAPGSRVFRSPDPLALVPKTETDL